MEVEMVNRYQFLLTTESPTEAILRHLIAEALLLKDRALPVQLRLRTRTMYRAEVVKMQTKHKTMKEIQEAKRSRETS